MKVQVVAPPSRPIPPNKYGGIERLAGIVSDYLESKGHEVHLLAHPDSKKYKKNYGFALESNSSVIKRLVPRLIFRRYAKESSKNCDVSLIFWNTNFCRPIWRSGIPVMASFHNQIHEKQIKILESEVRGELLLQSVSDYQRSHLSTGNWITIYNGISSNHLHFKENPSQAYVAYLGRISEEKGVKVAVEAAETAGIKLLLAGNVPPNDQGFFDSEIRPRIGRSLDHVGEIGDADKAEFLGNAKALLFPITHDEAFGLSMVEAMACGTPVIASASCSGPEVVDHGVTGFLVGSSQAMGSFIAKASTLDRRQVREYSVNRFSDEKMADQYLESLRNLVKL